MDKNRKKIMNRLKRIEGQLRGLQRLVESGAPCVDVLTQMSAVTSAMKKTAAVIIVNNMNKCINEVSEKPELLQKDFEMALMRFIDLS